MPHLKPMAYFSPSLSLCLVGSGRFYRFGVQREMHLVGEGGILSLSEQGRCICNRVQHRPQPNGICLCEVAQHMRQHALLDAGMANADPHTAEIRSDMRRDGADAIMP